MKSTTFTREQLVSSIIESITSTKDTSQLQLVEIYNTIHGNIFIDNITQNTATLINRTDIRSVLENHPSCEFVSDLEHDDDTDTELYYFGLNNKGTDNLVAESDWHEDEDDAIDALFEDAVERGVILNNNNLISYP